VYFAEDESTALRKAHRSGATITANVLIGYSLVCRRSTSNMNLQELARKYECDSVKGVDVVNFPEYTVYNWAQI